MSETMKHNPEDVALVGALVTAVHHGTLSETNAALGALFGHFTRLRAAGERAREDAARLDWLERSGAETMRTDDGERRFWIYAGPGGSRLLAKGGTLRAAIDAAIAARRGADGAAETGGAGA